MQSTLAFAPTAEDLDEFYFEVPVLTQGRGAEPPDTVDGADRPEPMAATA